MRKTAGISIPQMANRLGVDPSSVNRWEHGTRKMDDTHLAMFLTECGMSSHDIELFRVRNSTVLDRTWSTLGAVTDRASAVGALLRAELRASKLTVMASTLIPGLLQTSGYARFTMERGGVPETEIESRVAERIGRATMIGERSEPLKFDILLDESVLLRPADSPAATLAQIEHLSKLMLLPHVNIQVVPLAAGWSMMQYGQFTIYEFPDDDAPVAYQESRNVMIFFNDPKDVEGYRAAIERVRPLAMSPDESRVFMLKEIEKLEKLT